MFRELHEPECGWATEEDCRAAFDRFESNGKEHLNALHKEDLTALEADAEELVALQAALTFFTEDFYAGGFVDAERTLRAAKRMLVRVQQLLEQPEAMRVFAEAIKVLR